MTKPTIKHHSEGIFEFASAHGGGLIGMREYGDQLVVDLYRLDDTVVVRSERQNATYKAAQDAHAEIGAALLRAAELPDEVAGGLRAALERLSTVISDTDPDLDAS